MSKHITLPRIKIYELPKEHFTDWGVTAKVLKGIKQPSLHDKVDLRTVIEKIESRVKQIEKKDKA